MGPSDIPATRSSATNTIDVFIRLVLLCGLLAWCILILSPFTSILLWAMILAVALMPLFSRLSRALGGRGWLAATLLIAAGVGLVAVPAFYLAQSLVDAAQWVRAYAMTNTVHVPQLPATWEQGNSFQQAVAARWPASDGDLATLVREHAGTIRSGGAFVLGKLGGFSMGALQFIASIIVAGLFMVNAKRGGEFATRFLARAIGPEGAAFVELTTSTIRSVAKGILGVALIQATLLWIGLFIAGVPGAGLLALAGFLLAIVQIGMGPVTVGVLIYAFTSMHTGPAIALTVWLVFVSIVDNFIKPFLLGRGARVPTVVIFLGAIGGFLLSGIIGLFTGAVILSIGYQLMKNWMEMGAPSPGETAPVATP